jgi:hypothetical protein
MSSKSSCMGARYATPLAYRSVGNRGCGMDRGRTGSWAVTSADAHRPTPPFGANFWPSRAARAPCRASLSDPAGRAGEALSGRAVGRPGCSRSSDAPSFGERIWPGHCRPHGRPAQPYLVASADPCRARGDAAAAAGDSRRGGGRQRRHGTAQCRPSVLSASARRRRSWPTHFGMARTRDARTGTFDADLLILTAATTPFARPA